MKDGTQSVSEIASLLPYTLRSRFNSLGPYVRGLLEAENYLLPEDQVRTIHLAVFVYTLQEFLQAGTRAAKNAATTFEGLGIDGFSVGNTVFTKDNDATNRGESIARALIGALDGTAIGAHVASAQSMRSLVRAMAREYSRG